MNTTSRSAAIGAEVRQQAVVGPKDPQILEPQLIAGVGEPALAKALPGEKVGAAGAEQRPHRHLERAGVRSGHQADAMVVGQAEQSARALEQLAEPGLGGRERCERPSRAPPRPASDQPGRLAVGPEPKQDVVGRSRGFIAAPCWREGRSQEARIGCGCTLVREFQPSMFAIADCAHFGRDPSRRRPRGSQKPSCRPLANARVDLTRQAEACRILCPAVEPPPVRPHIRRGRARGVAKGLVAWPCLWYKPAGVLPPRRTAVLSSGSSDR